MAASKCKNFDWNIEITKILITLYEENECLYNNLNPDYKNRDIRLSIMASIAKTISDTTGKVCLVADVRKKINSLRSQYLAEKLKLCEYYPFAPTLPLTMPDLILKITKCKSGSGGDYIPTVYWFPLLRFLDISSEADASESNLDSQSPQVDSDSMDTQQSYEQETVRPRKTKKRNSGSTQDEDADGLIKEATATMRQMSQQITRNTNTISQDHITTFCNFVNSELTRILEASNNHFVNKAKRKIQMCLFDIWDEIDTSNLYEERSSTQSTNFSEDTLFSQNIPAETITYGKEPCTSVPPTLKSVTGTASSIVVRRNSLLAKIKSKQIKKENIKPQFEHFKNYNTLEQVSPEVLYCTNSPQEDKNIKIITKNDSSDLYRKNNPQGDGNGTMGDGIHKEAENSIHLPMTTPTQESSKKIVYYINNYDPEVIVTHTNSNKF